MSEKILVPVLGESINEASIAKWLKKKGDKVKADEPIVELETDKVNLEVPSPIHGVISETNYKEGDTVEVGAVLGSVAPTKEETVKIEKIKPTATKIEKINDEESKKQKKQEPRIFEETKKESDEKPLVLEDKDQEEPLVLTHEVSEKKNSTSENILSPAVRKIVKDNKINLETVRGT